MSTGSSAPPFWHPQGINRRHWQDCARRWYSGAAFFGLTIPPLSVGVSRGARSATTKSTQRRPSPLSPPHHSCSHCLPTADGSPPATFLGECGRSDGPYLACFHTLAEGLGNAFQAPVSRLGTPLRSPSGLDIDPLCSALRDRLFACAVNKHEFRSLRLHSSAGPSLLRLGER